MKKVKIEIGEKYYTVKLAKTPEEQEKGLQNVKELPDDEGMLFIVDGEDIGIWMKDTLIPLDVIFINDDMEVLKIAKGEPGSEEIMSQDNTAYVLELNIDSGVKEGDELEFEPDSKIKPDKMVVLNEEGEPQMELKGGERIFSRANTKILIKFAKKANITNEDKDYKALGKRLFKFLEIQDSNDEDYVELKK